LPALRCTARTAPGVSDINSEPDRWRIGDGVLATQGKGPSDASAAGSAVAAGSVSAVSPTRALLPVSVLCGA
jgi:hypothetical protein